MTKDRVRLAAVADLHCTKTSQGAFQPLFAQIAKEADVLLLCGDLTDYGLPEEAHVLAKELTATKIPVIGVLGNHDFESGWQEEVKQILCDAEINMLDGDTCEIHGIGFAGIKGFGGGFGRMMLPPWGETTIKQFVHETVDEALKLEAALARLRTGRCIAVLHYAPIRTTVEGEPLELFPFLGCTRLEAPLNSYRVDAAFHGHAHAGSPEGRTSGGIPVYNVSMNVLKKAFPDHPPYRIVEIPVPVATEKVD